MECKVKSVCLRCRVVEEQQARKGGQERLGHLGEETILGRGKSLLMGQARPGQTRVEEACVCVQYLRLRLRLDYDCELRAASAWDGGRD